MAVGAFFDVQEHLSWPLVRAIDQVGDAKRLGKCRFADKGPGCLLAI